MWAYYIAYFFVPIVGYLVHHFTKASLQLAKATLIFCFSVLILGLIAAYVNINFIEISLDLLYVLLMFYAASIIGFYFEELRLVWLRKTIRVIRYSLIILYYPLLYFSILGFGIIMSNIEPNRQFDFKEGILVKEDFVGGIGLEYHARVYRVYKKVTYVPFLEYKIGHHSYYDIFDNYAPGYDSILKFTKDVDVTYNNVTDSVILESPNGWHRSFKLD